MRRAVLVLPILLVAAACSGGPAGRFDALRTRGAAKPKPAATRSAQQAGPATVTLPASLPPASMFLGGGSWRTQPVRWCDGNACRGLDAPRPPMLAGPQGAAVFFALSAAPRTARLEVKVPGSAAPSIVALSPGTSMVWQASLPQGSYPLTLVATYPTSEVSWPFGVEVTQPKR